MLVVAILLGVSLLASMAVFVGVLVWASGREGRELAREGIVVERCRCGRPPVLNEEASGYYDGTRYAYFCDCGRVGGMASTIAGAARQWNATRGGAYHLVFPKNALLDLRRAGCVDFEDEELAGAAKRVGFVKTGNVRGVGVVDIYVDARIDSGFSGIKSKINVAFLRKL